jgi:hypothetical protein
MLILRYAVTDIRHYAIRLIDFAVFFFAIRHAAIFADIMMPLPLSITFARQRR